MITSTLLNIMNLMIGWVIAARPVWTPTLDPSISAAIGFAKAYNTFFPVLYSFTLVGLLATLFTATLTIKYSFKLADWVADIIP